MDLPAVRRWAPLAGVAVLLAVAAVAAAHSSPRITRLDQETSTELPDPLDQLVGGSPSFPPQPTGAATAERTEVSGWIGTAATALCVVVAAVAVGLLLWILIRDIARRRARGAMPAGSRPGASPGRTAAEVVAALDASLVDLSDADADPRLAVIACWVRLEQAAATAGTPRRIGDTPTDLVTRLLRGHDINADVLAALAHVYREARYATHPIDDRMRVEARDALRRLRAELTAAPTRPPAADAGAAR